MRIRRYLLPLLAVALLVPALAVTGARVLEPSEGRWVRLVSFTPYATVLYACVLLLLLPGLVRKRGASRGVSGVVSVLVLPILGMHLLWASGSYVGSEPAAAAGQQTFTVMTANLFEGRADPASVVDVALAQDVDVVVLVEATPEALAGLREAGLDRAFPHQRGEAVEGVAGTVVVSRYGLSQVVPLHTTYRGFAMRVALPGGGIDLLAVHPFPPLGDARAWRADHRRVLRAATAAEGPAVIAGDLNATLDHQPVRELAERGFTSAAKLARSGWQPTWPAAGEVSVLGVAVPSLLQLDHVLVDEGVRVLDTDAVTVDGTDHRALVATLAL